MGFPNETNVNAGGSKAGWRERWDEVRTLREELEAHEVDVLVVVERTERTERMVKKLKAAPESFRRATHGKVRTNNMPEAGGSKARAQERKLRAATKREINAVMERPARGTIETVPTGRGDDMEVITDPVAVAVEFCEFGKRRMGSIQTKWFRRYDVAAEHEVWFSDGMTTRSGRVTAIDDDGRYTLVDEEGDAGWIRNTWCVFAASGSVAALARQNLFCNIYPRNAR